jgi:hypothetical protein
MARGFRIGYENGAGSYLGQSNINSVLLEWPYKSLWPYYPEPPQPPSTYGYDMYTISRHGYSAWDNSGSNISTSLLNLGDFRNRGNYQYSSYANGSVDNPSAGIYAAGFVLDSDYVGKFFSFAGGPPLYGASGGTYPTTWAAGDTVYGFCRFGNLSAYPSVEVDSMNTKTENCNPSYYSGSSGTTYAIRMLLFNFTRNQFVLRMNSNANTQVGANDVFGYAYLFNDCNDYTDTATSSSYFGAPGLGNASNFYYQNISSTEYDGVWWGTIPTGFTYSTSGTGNGFRIGLS